MKTLNEGYDRTKDEVVSRTLSHEQHTLIQLHYRQTRGVARQSVLSRAFGNETGSYDDGVLLRCAPQLFTGMSTPFPSS